jgi:hypothetical protein
LRDHALTFQYVFFQPAVHGPTPTRHAGPHVLVGVSYDCLPRLEKSDILEMGTFFDARFLVCGVW